MSWIDQADTTLENEWVRLHPVRPEDRDGLHAVAMDPDIWRWFVVLIETDADFHAMFDHALAEREARTRMPFVVTDKGSGRIAGTMSYGNLAERDGRLEIGWSWLGRDFRGRGVNRWAKFLLMEHAFERLGAERVEFKTDRFNAQARHGLLNIGAVEEGTLRSFNPMPGGRRRDAVFFSVLRAEWPGVKRQLSEHPKVSSPGSG